MKIEIKKIRETPTDESLHLRISTPDGNCYNFRVPQTDKYTYQFNYGHEAILSLHKMLDEHINVNRNPVNFDVDLEELHYLISAAVQSRRSGDHSATLSILKKLYGLLKR